MVPQLWLIRSWGTSTLGFMGRVERLGADLSELDRRWASCAPTSRSSSRAPPRQQERRRGADVVNRTQLRTCAPTAIAKVVAHLRNDYECPATHRHRLRQRCCFRLIARAIQQSLAPPAQRALHARSARTSRRPAGALEGRAAPCRPDGGGQCKQHEHN